MKKNKLSFIGLTLLGLVLAGCGETPDPGPKPDPDPEPTSGWSEGEAAIMKEHCYGITIPYLELANKTVLYLDGEDLISVEATEVPSGYLSTYAALYLQENGWVGGDVSEDAFDYPLEEGTAFSFEKEIPTKDGNRHIEAFMFTYKTEYDEQAEENYSYPALNGDQLRISLYDPYLYEFPTQIISDYISWYYDFDVEEEDYILPPVVEGDYYLWTGQTLFAHVVNGEVDDNGYSEVLDKAGFKVLDDKDEYDYYNAISPDEEYKVYYIYMRENSIFMLGFEDYQPPVVSKDTFSNELLAQFFTLYSVGEAFEVPALNIEGATYLYEEDPKNLEYYFDDEYEKMNVVVTISGDSVNENVLESFIAGVEGWDILAGQYDYELTQTDEYRYSHKVIFVYNPESNTITVKVFLYSEYAPYQSWPTEEAKEAVIQGSQYEGDDIDELPAFTYEGVEYKINGNFITFLCGSNEVNAVVTAYSDILEESGFKPSDFGYEFTSPNEQYMITLDIMDNSFDLVISTMPEPIPSFEEFPLQMIIDALNRSKTFNDTFVGLDGADEYLLASLTEDIDSETEYDVYGQVQCVFKDTSVDIDAIAQNYINLLINTYGYVADEESPEYLYSPSNELQVHVEVEKEDEHAGYYIINVHFDNVINGNV